MSETKVAIIGGGISGLHTAYVLLQHGVSCTIYEARNRLGGRILCEQGFDLGPSWFWPGQAHVNELIKELGLEACVYQQYDEGDSLYQPLGQTLQRGVHGISMSGSYRLQGGMDSLINALEAAIISFGGSVNLMSPIEQLSDQTRCIRLRSAKGCIVDADYVVIAAPPRVVLSSTHFVPALGAARRAELNAVDTWMAGQAKAVMVYEHSFWRSRGLSGDVFSQLGPLSEIHDASLNDGSLSALFGFLNRPPRQSSQEGQKNGQKNRVEDRSALNQLIIAQLTQIFGEQAAEPKAILYKDWAKDSWTATHLDQSISTQHPANVNKTGDTAGAQVERESGWCKRLIWSGSEMAEGHFKGYIEGALTASHQAAQYVRSCLV